MNATDEMARSLVVQRSADWFVAHRGGELSAEDRAAFVAWLKASPEHVREYLAMAGLSRELDNAARHLDVDIEAILVQAQEEGVSNVVSLRDVAPLQSSARESPRSHSWSYALAAALAVIAIGMASLWLIRDGEVFGIPRTYRTAHGEQSTWRLPDGSVIHLNTDSRVTVRFSDLERQVDVERGQAHFRVAHETARRFRVTAGDAEVIAVGTEFDVYRRSDATVVTVVEGKVAVLSGVAPAIDIPTLDIPDAVQLDAGQQLRVRSHAKELAPVQADVRQTTAWLQRQIVFEEQPLAEVVSEFNRYSRVPIAIEDESLAALRISGVINAYDTESFLEFLGRLDGVAVEAGSNRIRVRSRPP